MPHDRGAADPEVFSFDVDSSIVRRDEFDIGAPGSIETLLTYFAERLAGAPDKVLFRSPSTVLSTGEVAQLVAKGIHQLEALSVTPKNRVIGFTDETIPLAILILTTGLAGAIPTAISPVFSEQYLRTLCEASRARAIVTTPAFHKMATSAECGVPVLTFAPDGTIISTGSESSNRASLDLEALTALITTKAAQHDPRDPLLIQATSGSTGVPKLVLRNHRAFTRYATFVGDELARAFPGTKQLRILISNALTHAFACHMMTVAMRLGAEMLIPTELDVRVSLDEVRMLDPDVVTVTPRVLHSLVRQQVAKKEPPETPLFGPSARLLLSAGGRGDAATLRSLREQGVEVIEFYGSSEASLVALTPLGQWRPGRCGRPLPDVDLKISPMGELSVRSPGVMIGYFGNSELTELVLDQDGFYRTGDLGRIDSEGYLEILGRRRDVFNTFEGSNIYPERIELLLEAQPWVEQAILIGDGRSYLTAHLVVAAKYEDDKTPSDGRIPAVDGILDPKRFRRLYDEVGRQLEALNLRLELVEQILAFALYSKKFPTTAYAAVHGKVQRRRASFGETHAQIIELLYRAISPDSPMLVPPKERRFAARVDSLQLQRDNKISAVSDRSRKR